MNEGTHTKYNEEHMGGDFLYVKTKPIHINVVKQ